MSYTHFRHSIGFHWWTDWYRISDVKAIERGKGIKVGETANYSRYCFYPECAEEQTDDMHYNDMAAPERFE